MSKNNRRPVATLSMRLSPMPKSFGAFGELFLFSACLAAGKHFYDNVVTTERRIQRLWYPRRHQKGLINMALADAAYDPFARGRFLVGVRTIEALDSERNRPFNCEIWYPAT